MEKVNQWTVDFHLVMRGVCRCASDDPKVALDEILASGKYDVVEVPGEYPYVIDRAEFVEVDLDEKMPLDIKSPLEDMPGFVRYLEKMGAREVQ